MAKSSKIRVLLSSRNKDRFPAADGEPLTRIREALKTEIEAFELFGEPVFEVWINEHEPPAGADQDLWAECLDQVRDADVVIALTNGYAGWVGPSGDVGICHAELMEAYNAAPGKLRVISLGKAAGGTAAERRRNAEFQKYLDSRNLFSGPQVNTVEELSATVKRALRAAVVSLAQSGVIEAGRGRGYLGDALDWTRMDFRRRKAAMEAVLQQAMARQPGAVPQHDKVVATLAGKKVLLVPHAIPAALSVAQAKEMVGRPFLKDHELLELLPKNGGGPVHVIACHKTATETQATALLGFPDAIVATPPFGVYVADPMQKIQFVFIVNCRDSTTTRFGVQRFFEWLETAKEAEPMAQRALARARIVGAIARELPED
jgi:hypothetical protein